MCGSRVEVVWKDMSTPSLELLSPPLPFPFHQLDQLCLSPFLQHREVDLNVAGGVISSAIRAIRRIGLVDSRHPRYGNPRGVKVDFVFVKAKGDPPIGSTCQSVMFSQSVQQLTGDGS